MIQFENNTYQSIALFRTQTSLGKFLKNSSDYAKDQLNGFPQKQIKQFKIDLIKNISDDLIKDIDNQ